MLRGRSLEVMVGRQVVWQGVEGLVVVHVVERRHGSGELLWRNIGGE